VPPAARQHARQQRARDERQAAAVGVDHRDPVVRRGGGRRLEAQRQPRVVDEHVHGGPLGGQRGDKGVDGRAVAHVQRGHAHGGAQLGGQRRQAVRAPARRQHAVPVAHEAAGDGRAKAGRRTRHQHQQRHDTGARGARSGARECGG